MNKEAEQAHTGRRHRQIDALGTAAAETFARLTDELEGRLAELTEAVLARQRELLPGWVGSVFSEPEASDSVAASLRAELASFRLGALPENCPEVDAHAAQIAARISDLKLLLGGYRVTQIVLWQAWFERVEDSSLGAELRSELLQFGSEFFFLYTNLLSDYVADLYQRELEQLTRSGDQRRLHAVRSLLEGEPLLGSQLDVELDRHHLGVIAWGADAEPAARSLAEKLGRPLFVIGPINDSWWGWISGQRPLTPLEERAIAAFSPAGDAHLALGLEAYGEAGFRATHRQALRARSVCPKPERPIVQYADVAVEALISDNQADAHAFVAHELRGIDEDSPASQRIRETISAYFAAGHNAASAAAALGIHQQTVANRLRAAEERLRHPIGARRVELETALRLRGLLDRKPPA
jgi:hypothetical protein